MTMGIVDVASLAARVACRTSRDDDVYLETHQLGRERGEAIEFSLCISILDDNVLPLHVPKLAQTLRNASMRVAIVERETAIRYPIRGIFVGCCASAEAKRKEHGAKSKDRDFFLHVFFSVSIHLSLDT